MIFQSIDEINEYFDEEVANFVIQYLSLLKELDETHRENLTTCREERQEAFIEYYSFKLKHQKKDSGNDETFNTT